MKIGTGIDIVRYFYAIAYVNGLNVNSSFSYRILGVHSVNKHFVRTNYEVSVKNIKRK